MEYVRSPQAALRILALAALTLVGCGRQDGTVGTETGAMGPLPESHRIIVKLRDPARNPASPEILHELSQQAGLSFIYLRPLSGGAHLLAIEGAPDTGAMAKALDRLGALPIVEYVEPDQLMRHQLSPGKPSSPGG